MYRNLKNYYTLIRDNKGNNLISLIGVTVKKIPMMVFSKRQRGKAPMEVIPEGLTYGS